MTDTELGSLLEAFANYYWSVPVEFVLDKLKLWHPEVSERQAGRLLKLCNGNNFRHHFRVVADKMEQPELVADHLLLFGEEDYRQFLAARISGPFRDCEEEQLLKMDDRLLELPEARKIIDYGKSELGLDDKISEELLIDCQLAQPYSLYEGISWVKFVLKKEQFGRIHFQTIDQVKRFRELGNELYLVLPNPVLRGWMPAEIENAPVPVDDIPERQEDIPDSHQDMDKLSALLRDLGTFNGIMEKPLSGIVPKRKIGRNEPCPCGSGKKYKKCCGRPTNQNA